MLINKFNKTKKKTPKYPNDHMFNQLYKKVHPNKIKLKIIIYFTVIIIKINKIKRFIFF